MVGKKPIHLEWKLYGFAFFWFEKQTRTCWILSFFSISILRVVRPRVPCRWFRWWVAAVCAVWRQRNQPPSLLSLTCHTRHCSLLHGEVVCTHWDWTHILAISSTLTSFLCLSSSLAIWSVHRLPGVSVLILSQIYTCLISLSKT